MIIVKITLETWMLMGQPCYHHHFSFVCVFDHIATVTMQLKLLLESVRWQTAAFEWTVYKFPRCPLPSCVSWHENWLYVWLQRASMSLLAYMSLLFRFSFRRSLLKPQAPAMPVSQPLLYAFICYLYRLAWATTRPWARCLTGRVGSFLNM